MLLEMTTELRKKLIEKRHALGITVNEVAAELGVKAMTVRRWESGETTHCIHALAPLVNDFLEGKYDERFPISGRPSALTLEQETLKEQIRRLVHLYLEAKDHPDVRRHILTGLHQIASTPGITGK